MLKTFSGRRPSQVEFELNNLIHLFKEHDVRSYVEIGAREGDTFYDIVSSMPVGSRAVAVDLPGGYWGKITTGKKLKKCAEALRAKGYQITVIFGDSTSDDVVQQVLEHGPLFDAMLIDGDHRYAGVKRDWELYGPRSRIVAFHDIVGHGQTEKVHNTEVEVPRLWSELKDTHPNHVEFVGEDSKMGIGVVFNG